MNTSSSFSSFQNLSDQQIRWKKDRLSRQRIPLNESWRGCLGLAALFRDVDAGECHGERVFYPNDTIQWACLRDVPPGHFPGSCKQNSRDVNYAGLADAELHHGMPRINFSRTTGEAWDLRFMPFDRHRRQISQRHFEIVQAVGDILNSEERPREFGVLNRMSARMTNAAFFGTDFQRRPIRPAWAERRRMRGKPFRLPWPGKWMPRPYLGFPIAMAARLYSMVTESRIERFVFECPACHCRNDAQVFHDPRCRIEIFDDGDFAATCPRCRVQSKYELFDTIPSRIRRRFSPAFQKGFCDAVARGLPLQTTAKMEYLGCRNGSPEPSGERDLEEPNVFAHAFRLSDGREETIYLPRSARVDVVAGQRLAAGERWCSAVPDVPASWLKLSVAARWNRLHKVCGGKTSVDLLQLVWFDNQAVRLEMRPGQVFFPTWLISLAVKNVLPVELMWDFSPCERYVHSELEAAIFPPLPMENWDILRFNLPGEVDLDASIGDPRYCAQEVPSLDKSRWRPHHTRPQQDRSMLLSTKSLKPLVEADLALVG